MNVAGKTIALLGACVGVYALLVGYNQGGVILAVVSVVLIGFGAGLHFAVGGQQLPPREIAATLDSVDSAFDRSQK